LERGAVRFRVPGADPDATAPLDMHLPPLLVVDDERNMRLSLETVMADEGYRVQSVESAEEGLRWLEERIVSW
jgi:PleD family two-component response regulator